MVGGIKEPQYSLKIISLQAYELLVRLMKGPPCACQGMFVCLLLTICIYFRLHEFDDQVRWVREGMTRVVPVPLLSLFTGYELETMVCGSPDIPLSLLKSVATYKGIDAASPLVQWFWDVMEDFSNSERSLFLRFVWGRTRLPRTIADFRGRDFVLQVS
jgi:E3 ubiquitin-protein ligase HERC2